MQPNSLQCCGQPVIFRSLIFRRGTIKDVKQLYIIHLIYTSSITSPLHNFLLHEFPLVVLTGLPAGPGSPADPGDPFLPYVTKKNFHEVSYTTIKYIHPLLHQQGFLSIDKPPLLADYRVRISYFQLTPKLLHSRLHG